MNSNILKSDNLFTLNDYEQYQLSKQYDKLNKLSSDENNKNNEIKENKRIYNLSLKKIGYNLSIKSIDIIDELVKFIYQKDKTFNGFMLIFTKDDRLIYAGILIVLLAFCLFFINLTL